MTGTSGETHLDDKSPFYYFLEKYWECVLWYPGYLGNWTDTLRMTQKISFMTVNADYYLKDQSYSISFLVIVKLIHILVRTNEFLDFITK